MIASNNMPPITDLLNWADHAANKSDRWLFIATLLLLGLVLYMVGKYFVKQHQQLISDHRDARAQYYSQLTTINAQQTENNSKMIICLDRNTQLLARTSEALEQCAAELHVSNKRR